MNKKFIFFGSDNFSIVILEKLKESGFVPEILVTAPDKPAGRGQKITEPLAKTWVKENLNDQTKILQPEKLDRDFIDEIKNENWDFFVVASYGKIIPKEVLDIPEKGSLNVHPSLLPFYRGASPVESAILNDSKETGVTIMLMDEKMDHGPILNQEVFYFNEWPSKNDVEKNLAEIGGELLAETIPLWLENQIEEQVQDHGSATFTKKITKEMGEVEKTEIDQVIKKPSSKKSREIFLKVQALNPWPGVFFFIEKDKKQIRVKIKKAVWITEPDKSEDDFGELQIETVLPEGKKEMNFRDFKRSYLD